jgi:DNA-binding transcriptional LysR family regulator
MRVFTEVAKQQGFSAAARKLHLSTTAVSRYVRELEDWLSVELLHRTTRHLSLTDAGHAYFDRCMRILDEIDTLEKTSKDLLESPRGRINVTAPVFMGRRFLGPLLPRFLEIYPDVQLNLQLVDRYVNMVDEGFDVVIRIAKPIDSNLVSRKLGESRMVLVAAPAYLTRYGMPATVEDLQKHNCIVDSVADYQERWPLIDNGKPVRVRVANNVSINNGELVRELALEGLGITLLPDFFVVEDLREGRLTVVLKNAVNKKTAISVVYPRGRYLSSNVRVFLDFPIDHARFLNV